MKGLKYVMKGLMNSKQFICSIYFGLGCGVIALIIYYTN